MTSVATYQPQNPLDKPEIRECVDKMRVIGRRHCDQAAAGKVRDLALLQGTMAGMHLAFYQSLLQQYKLATLQLSDGQKFQGAKLSAWVEYCLLGSQMIEHHHEIEENEGFPAMVRAAPKFAEDMKRNIDQHHTFTIALKTHLTYFTSLSHPNKPDTYDPLKHLEILDTLIPGIIPHLTAELDTLSVENLIHREMDEKTMGDLVRRIDKKAREENPALTLPWYLGHNECAWFSIPNPVKFILKAIYSRKYSDALQFCPFSPFPIANVKYKSETPFYAGDAKKAV